MKSEKKHWKSNLKYDPKFKMVKIDGEYIAFTGFSNRLLTREQPAITTGNVIVIREELKSNEEWYQFILQHESQHIIQFYTVQNLDDEYEKNKLNYEKEACARQILKIKWLDARMKDSIVVNLINYGADLNEALVFVDTVQRAGKYPGVMGEKIII